MSVERGRPPGLAGGISGSSNRNWSSVRAWPEPKSPANARSSGVHMAGSRQETARNAAPGPTWTVPAENLAYVIPAPADRFGAMARPPLGTTAAAALITRIPYQLFRAAVRGV